MDKEGLLEGGYSEGVRTGKWELIEMIVLELNGLFMHRAGLGGLINPWLLKRVHASAFRMLVAINKAIPIDSLQLHLIK